MRSVFALLAMTLPAMAQTGPSPEEFAKARTACAAEVRQDCLFLLATEIALANPDIAEGMLNDIAFAQASSGDTAGAEQTLTLTTPGYFALAALGREEEVSAVFNAWADEAGWTKVEPEPPDPGEIALERIKMLVKAGLIDAALTAALAMPKKEDSEQTQGLRLIVDHHLTKEDFSAAWAVALRIDATYAESSGHFAFSLSGRFIDPRSEALLAVVKAQTTTGDLPGAADRVDTIADQKTQVGGRLVLAEAWFKAGNAANARAQLDLVLESVLGLEPSPYFGLSELTQSADLAFRNGEGLIARKHAETAHKRYTAPRVRRGSEAPPSKPARADLIDLATVLQLVGLSDKASALFAQASEPYEDMLFSTMAEDQQSSLLVSQIRLGDSKAAATIQELLGKEDPFWSNGLRVLHATAKRLIDLGFPKEALSIAEQLEQRLRKDMLRIEGEDPVELYTAILAKDPTLAPQALKDNLGVRAHFLASLALARSLSAAGQAGEARDVLRSLEADHQSRSPTEPEFLYDPVCAVSFIALTQSKLGLAEDAAQSRQRGLVLANQQPEPGNQSADLLILAASFPKTGASSLSFGLGCLEYHG